MDEASEIRTKLLGLIMDHFYEKGNDTLSKHDFVQIMLKAGVARHMMKIEKKKDDNKER